MTDVQRSIDRARSFRFAAVCGVVLDVVLIAVDLARGSATAFAPAVLLTGLLALVIVQTRLIGSMQRARDLNERAEQLELAAEAVKSRARPCAHPDAEPVDLSTGERVAWVCANPECNAELPADWTPQARGAGTLTSSGGTFALAATLIGSGTLSAKATWDDVAYASEASEHFAQLAKVGRESCVSPCSICEQRWLDEGRFE